MSGKGPFKRVRAGGIPATDPEGLFKELKNRSTDIHDLYAHQADILREYYAKHLDSSDVSLELPTGSGKTLVGLLIGEYRRRFRGERVLYLCPTKQLAHQAGGHAKDYGIEARVFVGSKRDYSPADVSLYRAGNIIAISTYSGLFNTNPGLYDPQVIILDDAHSAETYIASMWSVSIDRHDDSELYAKVLGIFEEDLPSQFAATLHQESRPHDAPKPEMIPYGALQRSLAGLREVLNSAIPSPDDPDLYFPWTTVREGLHACQVYLSWETILIRPLIPPTLTHKPFAGATQRVYMSATIGRGGELERATGIRSVNRIPTPKTYAGRGVGRRLFLFPDYAEEPKDYNPWIAKRLMATPTPRTLALAPTWLHAEGLRRILDECPGELSRLGAKDVEDTLRPFTQARRAVLLLTNRYDGIDLPNEDCRQLMMYGLPSKTNLQEEFLEDRLGLEVLLRERIKTRIEQGTGRCTRSDTDYAAVVMVGRSLLDFCARKENQEIFHPEIRAEMRFALKQQPGSTSDLEGMVQSFLGRDEEWQAAEQDITGLRAAEQPAEAGTTKVLSSVVASEVDFAYAMWNQDFERAVVEARKVTDALSGPALAPYRAFWYYLVANAAHLGSQNKPQLEKVADESLGRATDACRTVSWFAHALKSASPGRRAEIEADETHAIAVEGIISFLEAVGRAGPRFQKRIDAAEKLLQSTKADAFDRGLVELGTLLGFDSWKPEGDAAPDCVWIVGSRLAFLLEGKSDESPKGGVSVSNCRQTAGHLNWAKQDIRVSGAESKLTVLVSPREKVDPDALPHADKVFLLSLSEARALFERIKTALIEIRATTVAETSDAERDRIGERLTKSNLDPESIRAQLTSRPVAQLPHSK